MEEAAPELDLEVWDRISQAETEGKIFQRKTTFLCKARMVHNVEYSVTSQGNEVQIKI